MRSDTGRNPLLQPRIQARTAVRALCALGVGLLLALPGAAGAAQITAVPSAADVGVGDSFQIDLFLELESGEEASVFSAAFDLEGLGAVAGNETLTAGGPTWSSGVGDVTDTEAFVDAFSTNQGGARLVGSLLLEALAPGVFSVALGPFPLVQKDLGDLPFVEDVPLSTQVGATLASVTVPEPGAAALLLGAGLLLARRRSSRGR